MGRSNARLSGKVRTRAQQLYEDRGGEAGRELEDWFQAESEVLDNTILAPLYRRVRSADQQTALASENDPDFGNA